MRYSSLALTLVAGLTMACAPSSQVDEIVASHLEARGGAERLRALQSIRETGTATASGGRVARVVREIKRPDLFRLEFSSQGATSVFANDGATGWEVAPLQGVFEPRVVPPESDSAGAVDQHDLEGPLVDWRDKGHEVELVGREMLPGGEAFKLELRLAGGAARTDYIDVATRQLVRSDFTRVIRGRPVEVQSDFSDFREVDGLVFPHRIETRAEDRPETITFVIEEIELDPELDDDRFRLPE